MDIDLYWVVLFFFFFVLPVLQRILGAGKHGQPPQRRPPVRRMPDTRRLPETPRQQMPPRTTEPVQSRDSELDRAAEMIPAELWEILTGQRRPPVVLPPSPEPDVDEELAEDEEQIYRPAPVNEEREAAELMRRREVELERARTVDRTPPTIISLETEPLAEPARHAAFHAQLQKKRTGPAAVPSIPARSRPEIAAALGTRADLRRSIILQEILGPPRGLE